MFFYQRLLILLLLSIMAAHGNAQKKEKRPNIIYIMVDDMGYADLSGYGRKEYQTPQLDRLATQGIKFTQAYAAAPVCTPTRVSFMTGKYPARSPIGLREPIDWSSGDSTIGLPGKPTIASLLKGAGYHTVLIGKWHLGFPADAGPLKHGFSQFFGFKGGAVDFISHTGPTSRPDLFENEEPVKASGYLTDILTDKAISFLRQQHSQPFFLSLQYNAPHWPWQEPGDSPYPDTMRFTAGGSVAKYGAMMKNLDSNMGRFLAVLDETGLANETLVIFVSDNGGERYSDMGPLSGRKMTLREGGIRVPAFVRWPGKIKEGMVSEQPVITMDWTATILAAAGVKPSNEVQLDGVSLLPFLTQKAKSFDRSFYWRIFQRSQQQAMREGKWKYLKDEKGEYLFDLSVDEGEKNNLKESEKAIFERIKLQFSEWEREVLPPVALGK